MNHMDNLKYTHISTDLSIYIYIYMWGPIDPICSNCIGKGWAQYPVSYVQITLERAGPNIQFEDKRVSKDDQ